MNHPYHSKFEQFFYVVTAKVGFLMAILFFTSAIFFLAYMIYKIIRLNW